ncbi:hypothetical protein [Bacillus sp. EB01]|uniref:hypothetical protein n=1 Tax=Bacillus sp. EB01 TaxID=1347086 RepID=UPI00069369DB|nr:hypothetical protein [Bacillus sp. EB01]
MEFFYWLMIIFLITYEPVYGFYDYKRFKANVRNNSGVRVRYYKKIMAGLWAPTLIVLGMVALGPITVGDIGFSGIKIQTELLGYWVPYFAIGIGSAYIFILLYYWAASKFSERIRSQIQEAKRLGLGKTGFWTSCLLLKKKKRCGHLFPGQQV